MPAGYYAPSGPAPPPPPRPGTDPVFQAAFDSPYEIGDVPLRLTHYVREETTIDEAHVFLAAEVDVRRLGFPEQDGQSLGTLQYLLATVQREGGRVFRFDQTLDLTLPAETRVELVLRFKDEFSGSRLELREPFRVSAAPPAPAGQPAPAPPNSR